MNAQTIDLTALEQLAELECADFERSCTFGCGEATSVKRRGALAEGLRDLCAHVRALTPNADTPAPSALAVDALEALADRADARAERYQTGKLSDEQTNAVLLDAAQALRDAAAEVRALRARLAAPAAPVGSDEVERLRLACELAWGIIANAYGGTWDRAPKDWRRAACAWRDEHYHPALDRLRAEKAPGAAAPEGERDADVAAIVDAAFARARSEGPKPCPACGRWMRPGELRVTVDGLTYHGRCAPAAKSPADLLSGVYGTSHAEG